MPELENNTTTVQQLQRAIADALRSYQSLVRRADQLTQEILSTQKNVDALKQLSDIVQHYQVEQHVSAQDWIMRLRSQLSQFDDDTVVENTHQADGFHCDSDHLINTPMTDANADILEQQYQQHQASCQLMEQHCEQSQHYLQLLKFQAEQMRESINTLLSQVIEDPAQCDTIMTLQERVLTLTAQQHNLTL